MPQMSVSEIDALAQRALKGAGCDAPNAEAVARNMARADRDGATSHGIFRLPGYVAALKGGDINVTASPTVQREASSVITVDGDKGLAPLAQETALPVLIEAARENGIALAALNNIHHFAALWQEAETLAESGLVGISATAALPYVTPFGGSEALFGTNPFAFAWPRPNGGVMCFDMATAASARGELMIAARDGKEVPAGMGLDDAGKATTDPAAILNGGVQLPFGGYKGSALAMMVELMAGPMIGDRLSVEAREEQGTNAKVPLGGEVLIAIDPEKTSLGRDWQTSAERLFDEIEKRGARLPGTRRYEKRTDPGPREIPQAVLDAVETAMG